jgi:RHS repeat-associated protein
VLANDPNGDPISFQLAQSPLGMAIDASTGLLTWTPAANQVGTQNVVIVASDDRGAATPQTFALGVVAPDHPPQITSTPPTPAVVGLPYQYQVIAKDVDGAPVTFALTAAPAGMTINASTGLVSWTAGSAQVGTQHVVITASDGRGGTGTQTFDLAVVTSATDHPPVITSQPTGPAVAGLPYRYPVVATDADGDPIAFALTTAPAGMTINANSGLVSWTPTSGQLGSQHVVLTASDGRGGVGTQTFDLPVTSINHPPAITSTPPGPATIGAPYQYQVVATDPDGDPVNFSVTTAVAGMTIDPRSGLLTWTPTAVDLGSQHVVITAGDGRGGSVTQSFDLAVVSSGADRAPVITSQPPGPAVATLGYRYQVAARDPDGDPISFQLTQAPGGMAIDPNTGLVSWTPALSQLGTQHVVITASDGRGGVASQAFDLAVVVSAVDHPPVITSTPPGPAAAGMPYEYQVVATDQDGDPLSFRLDSAPTGMAIDPVGGLVEWTPAANQTGSQHVVVTVDDGRGGTVSQTFDLMVVVPASNLAPSITSTRPGPAVVGLPYQYLVVAQDADGDPVTFALTTAPAGMAIDASTGLVTWTPTAAQQGTQHVVVTARDDRGASVSQGFDLGVVVSAVNHAPVITSTAPSLAVVGDPYQYQVTASDADGDPVTFALTAGPAGMAITSAGVLSWTAAQAGTQHVVITASDGRGGSTSQAFDLSVVTSGANLTPTITSAPPGPAVAGQPYQYQVVASDADGDPISFALTTAPAGMTISAGGLVTWTPPAGLSGMVQVNITATDGRGAGISQIFNLNVVQGASNSLPVISSKPATTVQLGLTYVYPVQAADADGDPLAYTLTTAPAGMSISPAGVVTWKPTAAQVGANEVVLRVDDGLGGVVVQAFTVTVATTATNSPPAIVSTPPLAATVGRQYTYSAQGSDPNGDALVWSLTTAPAGMAVDAVHGVVAWTPTADQIGTQTVVLAVQDAAGAQVSQSFTVTVRGVDLPPAITSTPPVQATTGQAYSYAVQASDPENDALTFSLIGPPAGMTINASTGVIAWTPTAAGTYPVSIQVIDSQGSTASQAYTLGVNDLYVTPPVLTSATPPLTAAVGKPYQFTFTASDPAGLAVHYTLLQGPSGMTIGAGTGLLQWTPTAAQAGAQPVSVAAVNSAGGTVTQNFTLTAEADQAPVISSAALTTVTAGLTYAYDVQAADADGDAMSYALTQAPTGMTVDSLGRIRWTTSVADIGPHAVHLVVTDAVGTAAPAQNFTVTVQADTQKPLVNIQTSANPAVKGSTVTLMVSSADNVGVASVSATVNGEPVALDDKGFASLPVPTVGLYTIAATATDAAGNQGSATATLTVIDPSVTGSPTVTITSPADGQTITGPTDIVGSITAAHLLSYSIAVAPLSGGPLTQVFQGTSVPASGVLGQFDPTILANGSYILQITATNAGGQTATVTRSVNISGHFKLGNFTQTFTDLSIPVAGIPITVERSYDSLNAGTSGDFGYGWHLKYGDVQLKVSIPDVAFDGYSRYPAFEDGTRITVTMPGGQPEGYTFQPIADTLFGIPLDYHPSFVPDPGVLDQLQVADTSMIKMDDGKYYTMEDTGLNDYNPADPIYGGTYTILTPGGMKYVFDGTSGKLKTLSDRRGNTLNFSDNGIKSGTGKQVTFQRDPQGRIVSITDPNGNSIRYGYNPAGDLVTVSDRAGDPPTVFAYDPLHAHYLASITDPLGNQTVQVVYSSTGRAEDLQDVPGHHIALAYDTTALTQTITDTQAGTATVLGYDVRGNVTHTTDPLGGQSSATYGGNDLPQTVTRTARQPDGTTQDVTTALTYDAVTGEPTSITDAAGHTTYLSYGPYGVMTATSDALGNTVHNTYDNQGDLLQTVSAAGLVTAYAYDAHGNLTSLTKGSAVSHFAYDAFGDVLSQTNPDGVTTNFSYDANGNQTGTSQTWVNPQNPSDVRTVTTQQVYDGNDRAIRSIDQYGHSSSQLYDAKGRVIQSTDVLGNNTGYVYDNRDELIQTTSPDGTVSRTVYDAQGRAVYADDPHVDGQPSNGTHTIYDVMGRVVETDRLANVVIGIVTQNGISTSALVSAGTVLSTSKSVYNDLGQVTQATDEAGATTQYQYDAAGHQTAVINALGQTTQFQYDADGRQTATIDALRHTTATVYDADGRVVQTIFADGTTKSTTYDSQGRVSAETDQMGQTTNYQYDASGRLTAVIAPAVSDPHFSNQVTDPTTSYQYDAYGNLILVTDAMVRQTSSGTVEHYRQTAYTYDQFGHQLTHTLPMGQVEQTTYDAFGRTDTHTDFAGQQSKVQYDPLGRVALDSFFAANSQTPGETLAYHYDSLGRVDQLTDTQGTTARVTQYTYDQDGRETSVTTPEGTVNYEYDPATGQHTRTYTASNDVHYGYDVLGRLTTVSVVKQNGGTLSAPLVTGYAYDAVGNVQRVTYPNGTETDYGYDSLNRVISVQNLSIQNQQRTVLSSYDYTLRADGLESNGSYSTVSKGWTYDALDRLTQEYSSASGVLAPLSYVTQYTFDLVGNRLSMKTQQGSQVQVVNYKYNDNDQLTTETGLVSLNQTQSPYQTAYTYDANGAEQTVTRTGAGAETDVYGYDLRQDLASASIQRTENGQPITISAAYTYHEDGIRVESSVTTTVGSGSFPSMTSTTTQYLVDNMNPTGYTQVLEEYTNGAATPNASYVLGLSVLSEAKLSVGATSAVPEYLLTDGQGSTRLVTDASGKITSRYAYDAYGNLVGTPVGVLNPLATSILYVGQQFDANLLQYYLRARYYNAATGRFDRMDDPGHGDLSSPLTLHQYVYGGANPENNQDPSGHDLMGFLEAFSISMYIRAQEAAVKITPPLALATELAFYAFASSALTMIAEVSIWGQADPLTRGINDASFAALFALSIVWSALPLVGRPSLTGTTSTGLGGRTLRSDQVNLSAIRENSIVRSPMDVRRVIGEGLRASGSSRTEFTGLFAYMRGGGGAGFQGVTKSALSRPDVLLANFTTSEGEVMAAIDVSKLDQAQIYDLANPALRQEFLDRYPDKVAMYDRIAGEGTLAIRGDIPAEAVVGLARISKTLDLESKLSLIRDLLK